jgi:hypothetical protein
MSKEKAIMSHLKDVLAVHGISDFVIVYEQNTDASINILGHCSPIGVLGCVNDAVTQLIPFLLDED